MLGVKALCLHSYPYIIFITVSKILTDDIFAVLKKVFFAIVYRVG